MNETNQMKTLPAMELRETLNRFTWLLGMLMVIWAVTTIIHEPVGRLIDQRQAKGQLGPVTGTMLAQR